MGIISIELTMLVIFLLIIIASRFYVSPGEKLHNLIRAEIKLNKDGE